MRDVVIARAACRDVALQLMDCGITGVALFGSRATGTAGPGSDWDIMLDLHRRLQRWELILLRGAMQTALQLQGAADARVGFCSPLYTDPYIVACAAQDCIPVWP